MRKTEKGSAFKKCNYPEYTNYRMKKIIQHNVEMNHFRMINIFQIDQFVIMDGDKSEHKIQDINTVMSSPKWNNYIIKKINTSITTEVNNNTPLKEMDTIR